MISFKSIAFVILLVSLYASKLYGIDYTDSKAAATVDKETGTEKILHDRQRRMAVALLGRAAQRAAVAVDKLLVDATKLPKRSSCCEEFTKTGGYRDAVRDFNSMSPEGVGRFILPSGVMAKSGEIGDRSVLVKSSGLDGKPVLEIIRKKEYLEGKDIGWAASNPPIIRITYSSEL